MSYPVLSPQSASSSTLITQAILQYKEGADVTIPRPPVHLHITSPRTRSQPPPLTRMGPNGFIEPHHSNLPRRRTRKKVPTPLSLDVDTPIEPVHPRPREDSVPLGSAPEPPTAATSASQATNATDLATSNDDTNASPRATQTPPTPLEDPVTPIRERRDPSSLPFHIQHNRDKSRDLDHDLSFDVSAGQETPPQTCRAATPASGPSRANLPRRRPTRKGAKASGKGDGEGGQRRGRRHVRGYVLDGAAVAQPQPRDVKSNDTEEDEEMGGLRKGSVGKEEGSSVSVGIQDPNQYQLLRGGNVEVVIGLSHDEHSLPSSSRPTTHSLAVEQPVVVFEASCSESSVLKLSLPPGFSAADVVEGSSHLTYDQYAEACKFILASSSCSSPIKLWASQPCRKEEAWSLAVAFLSCCDRIADRKPHSDASSPQSTAPPTSPLTLRPNTLPTPSEVEELLEVDVALPAHSGVTSGSSTSTLPTPDVYAYSRTHHLVFGWADRGRWIPRVGPAFDLPTTTSSPPVDASSTTAATALHTVEPNQPYDLERLKSVDGLIDEWRGILSFEGLEAVEAVVTRLAVELGKDFEQFVHSYGP